MIFIKRDQKLERQTEIQKETPRRLRHGWRYIIAAVLIPLVIIAALVFILVTQGQKPDPLSDKLIREALARELRITAHIKKDPNDFTERDFAEITIFGYSVQNKSGSSSVWPELSDIKILEKFINLKELHLNSIRIPDHKVSKVMALLGKLGILMPPEKNYLDLSPLENLANLETLTLFLTQINDIKPLESLTNLKELDLSGTDVSDIEPLAGLSNLQKLSLSAHLINNLTVITKLKNLKELRLYGPITDNDKEYLRNALPELKITFILGGSIYHNPTSIRRIPE